MIEIIPKVLYSFLKTNPNDWTELHWSQKSIPSPRGVGVIPETTIYFPRIEFLSNLGIFLLIFALYAPYGSYSPIERPISVANWVTFLQGWDRAIAMSLIFQSNRYLFRWESIHYYHATTWEPVQPYSALRSQYPNWRYALSKPMYSKNDNHHLLVIIRKMQSIRP